MTRIWITQHQYTADNFRRPLKLTSETPATAPRRVVSFNGQVLEELHTRRELVDKGQRFIGRHDCNEWQGIDGRKWQTMCAKERYPTSLRTSRETVNVGKRPGAWTSPKLEAGGAHVSSCKAEKRDTRLSILFQKGR